jgi:Rps23 Pro-64 3,4-dihydroxylase Tpa1-like proline 4-hydroxylase
MDIPVSQSVKNSSAELNREFESAQPFRHIAIDNFLDEDFARSLLEKFPPFDKELAIIENGEVGGKVVHEKISKLGPVWEKLDKLVQSADFLALISKITGIPGLNFDPDYFGGGTHENLHGQSLNPHVDFNFHPVTRQHRRMNLILYLSPEWKETWGGCIQLHRDPYVTPAEDDIVTVIPALNRCVIFETNEYSWHGFERIELPQDKRHLSRKSFALYYYTDSRPQEELGAEHSTIYVERHLPEDFHAGMELSGEQLQHVRNLLISRDGHLKRLYADIQDRNTELNKLLGPITMDTSIELDEKDETGSGDSAELKMKIVDLQRCIQMFENSTSWRITKPLRTLKQILTGKR